jgi:hypothetical protein
MTTILIKPRSKKEQDFLKYLFEKMQIEAQVVEEASPNYETRKAMQDVSERKGTRVKNSTELFSKLGI